VAGARARDRSLTAALGEAAQGGPALADVVALEVGAGQAPTVAEMLVGAGYPRTETRQDVAGIPRVVIGRQTDGQ
jgi:hypothetical protein